MNYAKFRVSVLLSADAHHCKDQVEESGRWKSEEQNCEEESSGKELINVVRSGIDALAKYVQLLSAEKTPQRWQSDDLEMIESAIKTQTIVKLSTDIAKYMECITNFKWQLSKIIGHVKKYKWIKVFL